MKTTKQIILSLISFIILITLSSSAAFAHPGRLDSNGGHYNRKTGEYHYHDRLHTESDNSSSTESDNNYSPNIKLSVNQKKLLLNTGAVAVAIIDSALLYFLIRQYCRIKKYSNSTGISINYFHSIQWTFLISIPIIYIIIHYSLSLENLSVEFARFTSLLSVSSVYFTIHLIKVKAQKTKMSNLLKTRFLQIKETQNKLTGEIYNKLKANLNEIKSEELKIKKQKSELERKKYKKLFAEHTLEELCNPPDGIRFFNNKIYDMRSAKKYGRYTAYKAYYGSVIHFESGCCGAYYPVDLLNPQLSFDSGFKAIRPCINCYDKRKADLLKTTPEWYKKYKTYLQIAKVYKLNLNKIYFDLYKYKPYEQLINLPEDISVQNGELTDTLYEEKYGRFTGYKTPAGKVIHLERNCCGADIPVNMTDYIFSSDELKKINFEYKICQKCKNSPKFKYIKRPPDWCLEYLYFKQIKEY